MQDFFEVYADRIDRRGEDECWEWTGARITAGYGHTHRKRKHVYAHRAAYESVHGAGSADGIVVRHHCDNPPCCNPRHLVGGTTKDNIQDMFDRGRANRAFGEDASKAKLTEAEVVEMRALAADGMPLARIAERFPQVERNTVDSAVKGETWTHLPGAVPNPTKATIPGAKPGQGAKLLNAALVSEIKDGLRRGVPGVNLACAYGVSPVTISAIKTGRIWSHVD